MHILTFITNLNDPRISTVLTKLLSLGKSKISYWEQNSKVEIELPEIDPNYYELLAQVVYYPIEIISTISLTDTRILIELGKIILHTNIDKILINRYLLNNTIYYQYLLTYRGRLLYRPYEVVVDFQQRVRLEDIANIGNVYYLTNSNLILSIPTTLEIYYHPEGIYLYRSDYPLSEPEIVRDKIATLQRKGYISLPLIDFLPDAIKIEELVESFNLQRTNTTVNYLPPDPNLTLEWLERAVLALYENRLPTYRFATRVTQYASRIYGIMAYLKVNSGHNVELLPTIKAIDYMVEIPVKSWREIEEIKKLLDEYQTNIDISEIQKVTSNLTPELLAKYINLKLPETVSVGGVA